LHGDAEVPDLGAEVGGGRRIPDGIVDDAEAGDVELLRIAERAPAAGGIAGDGIGRVVGAVAVAVDRGGGSTGLGNLDDADGDAVDRARRAPEPVDLAASHVQEAGA